MNQNFGLVGINNSFCQTFDSTNLFLAKLQKSDNLTDLEPILKDIQD